MYSSIYSSSSYSSRRSYRNMNSYSSFRRPRSSSSSGWDTRSYLSTDSDFFRPRFYDGLPRPTFDELYLKYRRYAPDDDPALDDGKVSINLELNKAENQKDHHTDKYLPEVKNLVVRRGQPFAFDVSITGSTFNQATDRIQLLFAAGDRAQESKGTLANVSVYNDKKDCPKGSDKWTAYIASASPGTVQVSVTPSCEAVVSAYKVTVKIFLKDQNDEIKRHITTIEDEIYVLFNPWNQGDQVYLESEDERYEYVLNDTGRVYVGNTKGRPWAFGQFEKCCFEASMYLLDKCYLNKRSHGNAILVARSLSAMANSCDNDSGVLTGNWSGKYFGGKSPTAWNGSVAILEEYMNTKRPVKYGQCWVFSGLLTTLCRAIGIPTRSVTNFSSAHDTDGSMTIDEHYNEDLDPIGCMNRDSVWNFHVWNEGWFRRPDLPPGYDGWQAFDATPQEESESMMRCGPAPLAAIKEGNVYLGYDTKFIFAEVNGDKVVWIVKKDGNMRPLKKCCNPKSVGKDISTKAVGSNARNDITLLYKHPEGTQEERDAVLRASKFSSRQDKLEELYDDDTPDDVNFKCEGVCHPNGDTELTFGARNTSTTEARHILFKIRTTAVYYTGVVGDHLQTKQDEVSLEPEEGKEVGWRLPASAYLNMINEDAKLKVYVSAKVKETNQFFTKNSVYDLDKPDLELVPDKDSVRVGERVEVTIKFKNTIDVKLTEGVIRLEGPGIQRDLKIPIHRGIEPGQEIVEKVPLTPQYSGKRELIACFNARQLTGITGVLEMDIKE